MEMKTIDCRLTVCQLTPEAEIDLRGDFYFIAKTDLSGGGCSGESGKTGGRMEGISDTGRAGFFHDRRSLKAFRDSGRRKNRDFCGLDL